MIDFKIKPDGEGGLDIEEPHRFVMCGSCGGHEWVLIIKENGELAGSLCKCGNVLTVGAMENSKTLH